MQVNDIDILQCVDCSGKLKIERRKSQDDVLIYGLLKCTSCNRYYPIIEEVGIFFRQEDFYAYITDWEITQIKNLEYVEVFEGISPQSTNPVKAQVKVAKNWEYQHEDVYNWEKDIDTEGFHGKQLFWTFIPIDPNRIKNKIIYVACVGRGKEAYHVLQEFPRKIIANELGAEVYSITQILGKCRKDLIVLRYDVSFPPLKKEIVDIAICDHALQHVYDHKLAFSKITNIVKHGGIVSVCVYSYEHNFLMTHLIEPLKAIFKHLPLRLIRSLALLPAGSIYLLIHLFYMPLSRAHAEWAAKLPLYEHMRFWGRCSFNFIWSACFDLLHAPISYHFKRNEIEQIVVQNGLEITTLINTHGTTWSLVARKYRSGK